MSILNNIRDRMRDYNQVEGENPDTIAIDYDDALLLLKELRNSFINNNDIDNLLNSDRETIIKKLNSMEIFGMKLTVVDLVVQS